MSTARIIHEASEWRDEFPDVADFFPLDVFPYIKRDSDECKPLRFNSKYGWKPHVVMGKDGLPFYGNYRLDVIFNGAVAISYHYSDVTFDYAVDMRRHYQNHQNVVSVALFREKP